MTNTYTTVSGQTWDQIAYEVYGEERHCSYLMDANRDKLDYFVFPDGIILIVPDKDELNQVTVSTDYPAWRTMLNG